MSASVILNLKVGRKGEKVKVLPPPSLLALKGLDCCHLGITSVPDTPHSHSREVCPSCLSSAAPHSFQSPQCLSPQLVLAEIQQLRSLGQMTSVLKLRILERGNMNSPGAGHSFACKGHRFELGHQWKQEDTGCR